MPVDQELSALATVASLLPTDIIYLVRDPGGVAEADNKAAVSVIDARYASAAQGALAATALQDAPSDGSQYARLNAAWVVVSAGAALPVADTTAVVMGSVDNTKLLRFEVDGFTAGATRVMTPPNQDTLLAGQNFANVFSVNQTISNTAPALALTDTTASAKSLTVAVDADLAQLRESAGASGSLMVLDLTNNRLGIGTAAPKTAFEVSRATAGAIAMRLSGTGPSTVRLEMTEHLTDPFTRGGYIAYGNNINPALSGRFLELGSRFDTTTDAPAITIGTTTSCVFIGIMEGVPANLIRTIAIGRRSAPAHSDAIVIGVGSGADLTSPAASTITFGLNGQRLQVITATGAGFGVDAPATQLHTIKTDAVTAAVTNVATFGHNSSGTPAAGFGPGVLAQGHSSTTVNTDMGRLTYEWSTATHASRASRGKLTAYSVASEVECIRWDATGLVTMPQALLTNTNSVGLSSTLHAFQVGLDAGANIIISPNRIQARSAGGAATLELQVSGGGVNAAGSMTSATNRVTATNAIALATAVHAFQTGATASTNIAIDTTSIQARNNGAAATLNLNQLGGNILIGIVSASLGFYGSAAVAKQTITGSRGGNAALADLLTKLATLGLIIDSTS